MSMLDSFFSKGFKGPKCKTLLKLTIPRIKLLRNRREIQIKQMRKDIAKLLETGQEATARIRVEHIIREENMMAAQEIIELFCELIAVRLPIIETQRECPLDLKEAISSVCFAAPRCADLPELQQVQMLFAAKYGKEFVSAAAELMPDCGVNRQIIELLSIRAPQAEKKLKLLKEIAEEHDLDWDPAASETEYFKPHEDLLNGPTEFVSASKLPLPKENNGNRIQMEPIEASIEHSESDGEWDSLDLPEVPKVSLRTTPNPVSAPEIPPSPSSQDSELDRELGKSSGGSENILHEPKSEPGTIVPESSVASPYGSTGTAVNRREDKQFLPFISSPSMSSASFAFSDSEPTPTLSSTIGEDKGEDRTYISTTKGESQGGAYVDLHDGLPAAKTSVSPTKGEFRTAGNMDLQDVLAAAQAAADSAERAAAAARSAATLAQVTITELIKKRNDQASDDSEPGSYTEISDHSIPTETELPQFDRLQSHNDKTGAPYSFDPLPDHGSSWRSEPQSLPSYDSQKLDFEFPRTDEHVIGSDSTHHQPQRLSSIEDDAYFSYPNLFTSAASNTASGAHPSSDNSPSSRDV